MYLFQVLEDAKWNNKTHAKTIYLHGYHENGPGRLDFLSLLQRKNLDTLKICTNSDFAVPTLPLY